MPAGAATTAQFHASYLASASELTLLQPGVDALSVLMDTPLRTTSTQIAGNELLNVLAILSDERNSGSSAATSATLHIQTNPPAAATSALFLGSSPAVLASNCQVSMNASGSRILIYGQNIATKLHTLAQNNIVSSLDLTAKIPYQGKRIVLSDEDNCVFFAAYRDGYGLLDGQNGIFCYRISDDSLNFICAAGASALDPELAVSADGKVLVFRRLNAALAVAEWQHGLWFCSDDYPIRATSCHHPAISADGRFIACEASQQAGGLIQIYRYDRWRNMPELVSLNAAGQPANADCRLPAISPDGKQVSFISAADNLSEKDTKGLYHVYRGELESPLISEDWMLLYLHRGWNAVAIPFAPTLESMTRLQDCAEGMLWAWNAEKYRFAPLTGAAAPGQGFLLWAANDASISISGTAAPGENKINSPGWHLLGPAQVSGSPTLPLASPNVVFAFSTSDKSMVRIQESELQYGRACWIFVP